MAAWISGSRRRRAVASMDMLKKEKEGGRVVNGSDGDSEGLRIDVNKASEVNRGKAGGVFVNLLQNPETFTGYSGPSARRVWQA
ncbi:hypothetical protein EBZ70_10700, partial [bacterium]|nr:hypothetical protein [bacterium]